MQNQEDNLQKKVFNRKKNLIIIIIIEDGWDQEVEELDSWE